MSDTIPGIHHITAIAADAQKSIDFYTRVLGLRLVKLTVNFDDPGTYHLYFGDEGGRPGTILTFFPFAMAAAGKSGAGVVDTTTFLVPADSLEDWIVRLDGHGIVTDGPAERFGQPFIGFRDPDGLKLELAAGSAGKGDAILGFAGATLWSLAPDRTLRLLTDGLGYAVEGEEPGRIRLRAARRRGDRRPHRPPHRCRHDTGAAWRRHRPSHRLPRRRPTPPRRSGGRRSPPSATT